MDFTHFSANGSVTFDTIIIDEACQAVELSTLIPLRYSSKRVILIGDPNQLPPTVISKEASSFIYEQSLFARIQGICPSIVNLLAVQYRMHPSISSFPSTFFYDGRLIDGPENAKVTHREWHSNYLLAPYLFYDVKGQESKRDDVAKKGDYQRGRSLYSLNNLAEADVVLGLIKLLCSEFPSISVGRLFCYFIVCRKNWNYFSISRASESYSKFTLTKHWSKRPEAHRGEYCGWISRSRKRSHHFFLCQGFK